MIILSFFVLTLSAFPKSAIQSLHLAQEEKSEIIFDLMSIKNSNAFWNYTWLNQQQILAPSNETNILRINGFTIEDNIACEQNIIVLNSSKNEIQSYIVDQGATSCDIAFNFNAGETYYIMYNIQTAYSPSYSRTMPSGTFNYTYYKIKDKRQDFCTYAEKSVSGTAKLNCNSQQANNKIQIDFSSPKLSYSGTI